MTFQKQLNKQIVRLLDDFYLNYHVEEDSLVSDSLGQINTAIENLNKRLESIINHSKKIDQHLSKLVILKNKRHGNSFSHAFYFLNGSI